MIVGAHTGYNSSFYNSINNIGQNSYAQLYARSGRQSSGGSGAAASYGASGGINYGAVNYLRGLKTGAQELSGVTRSLTSPYAYAKTSAASSDSGSMSVSGGKGDIGVTRVKIDQVAQGQVNEGRQLKSGGRSGAASYNRFEIESGGKKYQFSFSASAGESNKQIQQKMADAINQSGIGISASINADKNGSAALSVRAKNTGAGASFSIRDVSGNAVALTGTGASTQKAQDAVYSVNGGAAQTSASNKIDLGNGVTATLKKASEDAITVQRGSNASYAANLVRDMAGSYNELLASAGKNGGDRLSRELSGLARSYGASLEQLGVGVDANGYMSIDENQLDKAAQSGKLEDFFTRDAGRNYGFANRLVRTAENVSENTSYYAGASTQNSLQGGGFNDYKVYNQMAKMNLLLNANAGMLFNFSA